jgi:hypothetical protein
MNKKLYPVIGVILLIIVGGVFMFTRDSAEDAPAKEKTLKKKKNI